MMETFNLEQAAEFLKLHPEELRRRAKGGRVPAAKVGKCWVFLKSDLVDYLRSLYAVPRQALQVMLGKELNPCHLSNAARSGGSTLPPPMGNEYADLLAPKRNPSRRSTTTASR
ncbi:helix-turn-helix domain-containing protein [Sideroxydans sp. CL21]|uniref:helix-turn-helix domain-containing protein n=1 Tax=Sideroxydans sp. CL21 TaxID=2600596 RepID=UPI0032DAA14D